MSKKLIIIRHGDYSRDKEGGVLSLTGALQMEALAQKIGKILNGDPVRFYSSTAGRAKQSAEIIANTLDLKFEPTDLLWSGPDGKNDHARCGAVCNLVDLENEGDETIILLTHLEYGRDLPNFVGKHYLGGSKFSHGELKNGQAFVIDFQTRQMTTI